MLLKAQQACSATNNSWESNKRINFGTAPNETTCLVWLLVPDEILVKAHAASNCTATKYSKAPHRITSSTAGFDCLDNERRMLSTASKIRDSSSRKMRMHSVKATFGLAADSPISDVSSLVESSPASILRRFIKCSSLRVLRNSTLPSARRRRSSSKNMESAPVSISTSMIILPNFKTEIQLLIATDKIIHLYTIDRIVGIQFDYANWCVQSQMLKYYASMTVLVSEKPKIFPALRAELRNK
uniref:Uncharacterized protein n=1 Tax=Romanomermis culicivorax TaxID=13658 RepID=A0A915IVK4_ROMCU